MADYQAATSWGPLNSYQLINSTASYQRKRRTRIAKINQERSKGDEIPPLPLLQSDVASISSASISASLDPGGKIATDPLAIYIDSIFFVGILPSLYNGGKAWQPMYEKNTPTKLSFANSYGDVSVKSLPLVEAVVVCDSGQPPDIRN